MNFTQRLVRARKEKNITQDELANMLGVTKTCISYWENGKRQPNVLDIKNICRILDVSGDELLDTKKAPSYMTELSADALFIARCFERADDSDKKLLMSVAENINARTSEHQSDEGNIELGRAVLARMREELKRLQSDIGEVEQG